MSDETLTLTVDAPPTRALPTAASRHPARPAAVILLHPDLARVGDAWALSPAEAIIGRKAPRFGGAPLGDPCLSRKQLELRWRDGFVARPLSDRNPLRWWAPGEAGPGRPLLGEATLPRGARLAVGDRLLLGLTERPFVEQAVDRMGLIGESAAMWRLRAQIAAVSRLRQPTWIFGPTGAGKELVARALHGAGPFVPVNCGALPEHLAESTLFGHERGAFTGATERSPGLVRVADGGTLFLDEVGELSSAMQVRLLRVIQEGTLRPVGGTRELKVDVRIVAATHRDLREAVAGGRFREDLYHRLAVHVIPVPGLEVRPFDVPRLFFGFLEARSRDYGELRRLWRPVDAAHLSVPLEQVVELTARRWPGNVRELQAHVDRTVQANLHEGPFSPATDPFEPSPDTASDEAPTARGALDPALRARLEGLGLGPAAIAALAPEPTHLAHLGAAALAERLRARLTAHLATHGFRQARAARALDLSRGSLVRLMDALGVRRSGDLRVDEIRAALAVHGGDLAGAAAELGVSARGLKLRMGQLGLDG